MVDEMEVGPSIVHFAGSHLQSAGPILKGGVDSRDLRISFLIHFFVLILLVSPLFFFCIQKTEKKKGIKWSQIMRYTAMHTRMPEE